jgi:hypothetical protein
MAILSYTERSTEERHKESQDGLGGGGLRNTDDDHGLGHPTLQDIIELIGTLGRSLSWRQNSVNQRYETIDKEMMKTPEERVQR